MPVQTTAVPRGAPALADDVASLARRTRPRPRRGTQAPTPTGDRSRAVARGGQRRDRGGCVRPSQPLRRAPPYRVWGAPGVGKTVKILQMFDAGLAMPRAAWIVMNIKEIWADRPATWPSPGGGPPPRDFRPR